MIEIIKCLKILFIVCINKLFEKKIFLPFQNLILQYECFLTSSQKKIWDHPSRDEDLSNFEIWQLFLGNSGLTDCCLSFCRDFTYSKSLFSLAKFCQSKNFLNRNADDNLSAFIRRKKITFFCPHKFFSINILFVKRKNKRNWIKV